jgi:DNA repair protein RecN (Recombination protein N)
LQKEIFKHLTELGLDKTVFEISIAIQDDQQSWLEIEKQKVACDNTGFDRVEFLISPNPGEELRPLAKIASGGELSRIMLALKSALAQKDRIPILVFDEIDSGIGGEIAEAVGRKLKTLAKSHQILCITHLQQIASFAETHYKVEKKSEKGRTLTTIKPLNYKERVEEIARLISGQKITSVAHRQASLMIEQAGQP